MTTVRIAAHREEASKMEAQGRTSRKRPNESSSSDQPDVPKPKKKKPASKAKPAAEPAEHAVSTLSQPSAPPPLPESSLALSKPGPSSQAVAETKAPLAAAEVPPKKKAPAAKPRARYLKPQRVSAGSWKAHIASLVVHRCVHQAESRGIDPRSHLNDINWSRMVEGLLKPEDMQMIWYFIHREYPDDSLMTVLNCTKPYTDLSIDKFKKEEIKLKYKDELPKPPLTPYMLFMKSKLPKLKRKHPDLQMTEVASKLGKKWNTIGQERQDRYKQQHTALKATYEAQLQKFYEDHPDARPTPPTKTKKSRGPTGRGAQVIEDSDETRRIEELKAQLPKQPMSAYLCFCKKKREKLHRKHPELSPNDVTVKLGKRWQSMGEEARSKYVKLHEQSVMNYKEQMDQFYAEHPDAKELIAKARKMKRRLPRSPAKQHLIREVALPPPVTTAQPPLQGVSGRGEGEGEGEEEEEEVEGEEGEEEEEEEEEEEGGEVLLTDHKQNGPENLDESGSESDSSNSTVED